MNCRWCPKPENDAPAAPPAEGEPLLSHGICPACVERMRALAGLMRRAS